MTPEINDPELQQLIKKLHARIKGKQYCYRCIWVIDSAWKQISPAQAMWNPHYTIRSDGSVSFYN